MRTPKALTAQEARTMDEKMPVLGRIYYTSICKLVLLL